MDLFLPVKRPSCLRFFCVACLPARVLHIFFVAAVLLLAICHDARAQDVLTHHYTNDRLGVQTQETTLTPLNVNYAGFGKVYSFPVLGQVYAQPLYVTQYTMADGTAHNVLFVATQQDYVYAFDADGNNPAQGYLWCVSLLGPGESVVLSSDVGIGDITPYIGITGTPVIDRTRGVLYVVAKSKTTSGTTQFIQRLHALQLSDGSEMLNGPTTIQATLPGTGERGTTVSFSALRNNQRPALLLASTPQGASASTVFIGWSSHGDIGTYHGWILGYDASDISKQVGAWTNTPNGTQAGIWMSGAGISTDGNGNLFAAGGNGTFDANTGGPDYGDSAFRLTLNGTSLTAADYFTPANQSSLNADDNDMGTSAMLLLPNQSGSIPHLAVTADKSGMIHLLNRDNMGQFTTPNNSSLESFSDGGYSVHNSLTFFNNTLYLAADGSPMQAWAFDPVAEQFSPTPQSQSATNYGCKGCDGSGSSPSISANGAANAVLWALDNSGYHGSPAVLHAYDPANLSTELYNSKQAANNRDAPAIAVKFTTPTIANGRVYVGGQNAISVYGLLSTGQAAPAPTFSPGGGNYTAAQTVTISDSIPGASIYYTTNGSTPNTGSTLYQGPVQVTLTETLQAVAIASGYSQSPVTLAEYNINGLPPVTQTQVSLATLANTYGIYTDGTKFTTGGIDGIGDAYSAALLEPSLTYSGVTYNFLPANQLDAIRPATGPVVSLPSGSYTALDFLAMADGGSHGNKVYLVTYTDGTTTKLVQSMSDWYTPQHFPGEAIALSMSYRDKANGTRDSRTFQLYQYSIPLDSTKTVASLTLPKDANIGIVAVTLTTTQAQTQSPPSQVSLAAVANTYAMYTDGTTFTTTGVDGAGNAYSATLLGSSLTYGGTQFAFLLPNQLNGVSGINAPVISLTGGAYSTLKFLGLAVNGSQPAQIFTVTYTDGTTSTFTQSLSDWYKPQGYTGEATAKAMAYRNKGNGVPDNRNFNLYQYAFSLNSAKTVKSVTMPNNQKVAILAITLTN